MLQQNKTLGFYLPAFFYMKIETDESLINIDKCSKITQATIYHEYIHFLQDLYTLYGLRNINYFVEVIYSINREFIKNSINPSPIIINDPEIITKGELFRIYYGTTNLSFEPFLITDYNPVPNAYIKNYESVPCIELNTISHKVGTDCFDFGAYAILESMAYIIENSIFGISSVPIFPYQIVNLIIDNLYSDLSLSTEMRVALCEEALNSGHPGHTFFELLDKLRELNQVFNDPNQFHLFCYRNYFLQDEHNFKVSLSLAIENQTKMSHENLKKYFPSEDIKLNPWFDFTFNKVKELRAKGFHFYKLVNNLDYFIKILNELGTPLISNNNSWYFRNPKIDQSDCHISILLAIRELMSLALGERANCELKAKCLIEQPTLVNDLCDKSALENSKRKPRCDLATLMYIWGLS